MADDQPAAQLHGVDPRIAFVQARITKTLENVKSDKIAKSFADEETL